MLGSAPGVTCWHFDKARKWPPNCSVLSDVSSALKYWLYVRNLWRTTVTQRFPWTRRPCRTISCSTSVPSDRAVLSQPFIQYFFWGGKQHQPANTNSVCALSRFTALSIVGLPPLKGLWFEFDLRERFFTTGWTHSGPVYTRHWHASQLAALCAWIDVQLSVRKNAECNFCWIYKKAQTIKNLRGSQHFSSATTGFKHLDVEPHFGRYCSVDKVTHIFFTANETTQCAALSAELRKKAGMIKIML